MEVAVIGTCVATSVGIAALCVWLLAGTPARRAAWMGGDGEFCWQGLHAESVSLDTRGWGPFKLGAVRLQFGLYALGSTAWRVFVWGHPHILSTFTFWAWILMGVYFLAMGGLSLAAACSAGGSGAAGPRVGGPSNGLKVLWVLCQLMATIAVFIFFVVWLALIPLEVASNGMDAMLQKYFDFVSASAHNLSVVFMAVELWLNRLTFVRSHALFIVLYANSYIVFSWFYHWAQDRFWYIFLDWNVIGFFTAPCYLVLAAALYGCFLWVSRLCLVLKKGAAAELLTSSLAPAQAAQELSLSANEAAS